MSKQTFAAKIAQRQADRKRNIKLIVKSSHASKSHTRCQTSQYVQPLTPVQITIKNNEARIEEIRDYLYKQYKSEGCTLGNLEERKALDSEEMQLLNETHYLRNPQRTPEMDAGSYSEAGGEYQRLPLPTIKSNKTVTNEDDDRPNTFGEFDAEWD